MNRRDWSWWRWHVICRESIEPGFGIFWFKDRYGMSRWSVDVWLGRRFVTVRWLRKSE